jgi:heat induced stress protein YflT
MSVVVGMFENTRDVDQAVEALNKAGFTKAQIGVIARRGVLKEKTSLTTTTEIGAIAGGALGGVGGLLVGLNVVTLAIPGIGEVVAAVDLLTVLGATLLGAGIGAIGGGIVGALVGLGLPEHEAHVYAEGVKRGNILITVQAPAERMPEVTSIFRQANAVDVSTRRQEWTVEGWTQFEEFPVSGVGIPAPENPVSPSL